MLLKIHNISKSYQLSESVPQRVVLNSLSLNVDEGETIAIVGPSGSGKTTLLNMIGVLDQPDSGSIEIRNKPLNTLNEKQMAQFRNREIGFVFQQHFLLPQCTVYENILLPSIPSNKALEAECYGEELLKVSGLWELRNQKPGELSGGESQRVAVIRALINKPSLLLADEPTGALDEENAKSMVDLLLKVNSDHNIALIVVTHSLEVAQRMSKIYHLKAGKLEIFN